MNARDTLCALAADYTAATGEAPNRVTVPLAFLDALRAEVYAAAVGAVEFAPSAPVPPGMVGRYLGMDVYVDDSLSAPVVWRDPARGAA